MRKDQQMIWAVVPAAGAGRRMGANCPKQYLSLAGYPVIRHTIERLLSLEKLQGVVVATSPDDHWWSSIEWEGVPRSELIIVVDGGEERSDSVLNGLERLSQHASDSDWVLVHDAARPCLSGYDLEDMVTELWDHPVGGILAAPLSDTIKRSGVDREIVGTVDRTGLWRALTPQMFRLGMLRESLRKSIDDGIAVTDDSQAIERLGFRPRLISGDAGNMKITHPGDILLAEEILRRQRGDG